MGVPEGTVGLGRREGVVHYQCYLPFLEEVERYLPATKREEDKGYTSQLEM